MKLKTLLLSGCLLVWLIYSCEDTGPEPIDMPDPTDTMPMDSMTMDTMPIDTIPIVDTNGNFLINQIKGNYLGTCYHYSTSNGAMDQFDTLYNVTITIDSLERLPFNGVYYYVLYDDFQFKFYIPEAEFIQDTVDIHAFGGSQSHSKQFQFIRSQRFLYSLKGLYPGSGFSEDKCYCHKQ